MKVQIQYEESGKWRNVGTTKIKKNGKFVYTDQPKSGKDRAYRVVEGSDNGGGVGSP